MLLGTFWCRRAWGPPMSIARASCTAISSQGICCCTSMACDQLGCCELGLPILGRRARLLRHGTGSKPTQWLYSRAKKVSETLRWPWSQQACTIQHAAPEILKGLPAGCSADAWSLGAIGFEMITGRRLVKAQNAEGALLDLASQKNAIIALPDSRCDATWCKDPRRKKTICKQAGR